MRKLWRRCPWSKKKVLLFGVFVLSNEAGARRCDSKCQGFEGCKFDREKLNADTDHVQGAARLG